MFPSYLRTLLRDTPGQTQYNYSSDELSIENIALAVLGTKRKRIAKLPPEVSNDTPRATFVPFGNIMDIQTERWSKACGYSVDNGVRKVALVLTRHDPSHLTVAGQRILLA
jgi:hypothetical protein